MKSFLAVALILCLAAPSFAAVPCDSNGDDVLSEGELVSAAFAYLDVTYRNGTGQAPSPNNLTDAAFVYHYWGGRPWNWSGTVDSVPSSFDRPIRCAVVMSPYVLETLRSIDYPREDVVGIDSVTAGNSAFFPEFVDCAVVGSPENPDMAILSSLDPDVVFVEAGSDGDRTANIVSEAGYPVVRVACNSPHDYPGEVRALGGLLGLNDNAVALFDFITTEEEQVRTCLSGLSPGEKPLVYAEDTVDYTVCGEGTPLFEDIETAGGLPAFNITGTVNTTAVLAVNPEFIVKLVGREPYLMGGYGDKIPVRFLNVQNAIGRRPGWTGIAALRTGNVSVIHTSLIEGPQAFIGVQYLAAWFHPDRCADLDPAAVQAEYLSRFQGLPGPAGTYLSGGA